jgi:hypothetical protein
VTEFFGSFPNNGKTLALPNRQTGFETNRVPNSTDIGLLYLGLKRPRREGTTLPPSQTEVKNAWSLASHLPRFPRTGFQLNT